MGKEGFHFVNDIGHGGLQIYFLIQSASQGKEISITELAAEVRTVVGQGTAGVVHTEPRPGDVMRLYADSTRAESLLGFSPGVSLREGLERLMKWYGESGRSPEEMLRDEVVHNWELGSSK